MDNGIIIMIMNEYFNTSATFLKQEEQWRISDTSITEETENTIYLLNNKEENRCFVSWKYNNPLPTPVTFSLDQGTIRQIMSILSQI